MGTRGISVGILAESRFESPSSASAAMRPPRTDVHVGFVDNGDGEGLGNHYVALPRSWE